MFTGSTPPSFFRTAVIAPLTQVFRERGLPTASRRSETGQDEGGERHGGVTTLRGTDDTVPARRQSSVGRQPVREFIRQERIPLLASVLVPIGIHTVTATSGRDHRDTLPPSVFIALPAVTQLLTSGAALNASRRYTACGPPPIKATGMSRPIAADGTIRDSTGAAWAIAERPVVALTSHNATATMAAQRTRSRIDRPFTSTSFVYRYRIYRTFNYRTVNHSSGPRGKIGPRRPKVMTRECSGSWLIPGDRQSSAGGPLCLVPTTGE